MHLVAKETFAVGELLQCGCEITDFSERDLCFNYLRVTLSRVFAPNLSSAMFLQVVHHILYHLARYIHLQVHHGFHDCKVQSLGSLLCSMLGSCLGSLVTLCLRCKEPHMHICHRDAARTCNPQALLHSTLERLRNLTRNCQPLPSFYLNAGSMISRSQFNPCPRVCFFGMFVYDALANLCLSLWFVQASCCRCAAPGNSMVQHFWFHEG
mmetsp:Transcript_108979/g.216441  ORF Transcript_108979/g.216441 Transcript_108979/m.216441 type:complete len:210 (+) Transcript_108979:358-987(+)